MNVLLIYMIKAAVYIAGFFLVYWLFLSRDTMYRRNRAFIILSVISALVLPMITIQTSRPINIPVFGKVLSEIFVSGYGNGDIQSGSVFTDLSMARNIYISGVILFSIKLIIDFLYLAILIFRRKTRDSNLIRISSLNTSGFSAFGYIFINEKLTNSEATEIIRHEQNHLDLDHSLDIIFMELISVIQWFNPAIHFFSRSLRAVHEYQADEGCLNLGINVKKYQKLILNQVFKSRIFTVTNSFSNPSLIKKRMIMMNKKQSKSLANFKLILILPVVAAVMMSFSSYTEKTAYPKPVPDTMQLLPPPPPPVDEKTANGQIQMETVTREETGDSRIEPFVVVEEMPMFPGGESELLNYIGKNTNYPENAKEKNIQGKIIIRFCVSASGGIERVSVLKGIDPELDQEALRVVNSLPKFKPGRQGGKEVPVWYMVPINFTLK